MLRILKIALVLGVAFWALFGLINNVTDWAGTTGAIAATTSMATFDAGAESWRATTNPAIVLAGALFIVGFKLLAACFALLEPGKCGRPEPVIQRRSRPAKNGR